MPTSQYRKSPRAHFIEYDRGEFFITICTEGRRNFFGEIVNSEMKLSEIGKFVEDQLRRCSEFWPSIEMSDFVVMPNHIHFLAYVENDSEKYNFDARCPNPSYRPATTISRVIPKLSRYISSFKGAVTKHSQKLGIEFRWQGRYYDHLIRGPRDRAAHVEYIMNNVANWETDEMK